MTTFVESGPRTPVVEAIRVDKVSPRARLLGAIRAIATLIIAFVALIPVIWIVLTAFKSQPDAINIPPKLFFQPSMQGLVNLFTDRRELSQTEADQMRQNPNLSWADYVALERGQIITGPSQYTNRLTNSLIIAGVS